MDIVLTQNILSEVIFIVSVSKHWNFTLEQEAIFQVLD
jgi:hypothetical protein